MSGITKKERKGLRVWIEIDTKKAKRNFKNIKKLLKKGTLFGAVTKSNAYGHGLVGYSKLMQKFGADWILVDSIMEAKTLRREGIKTRLLVLGYTLPENFDLAKKLKTSVTISTFEGLKQIRNKKINVHLKFDTGMGRQGFLKGDLPKIFKLIEKSFITIEGVYTHFAKAKVPKKRMETDKQIDNLLEIIKEFESRGLTPLVHAGATSGAILYKEAHFDMVRVGIGIYGLWPEKAVRKLFGKKLKLEPVLSWKTIVSEIKELPKGHGIGYDLTYKLKRDSMVAVLPIGYWHGYLRALSNKSSVLIKGKRAKLLGRVSMGMIVVDITDIKGVKVGDESVLIGRQGRRRPDAVQGLCPAEGSARREEITAEELGDVAGTINYEIVTRINPLSKKFYI